MGEAVTKQFRLILMSLMIVSGGISTLTYKLQNRQLVYEGGHYKNFFHPYMQTTSMFFGQAMALGLYFILRKRDPQGHAMRQYQARSQNKLTNMNKLFLMIPGACDLVSSTLQYAALSFIPGSVYQMMRGGSIVTTFILSIFFLKMKVKKTHVIGCSLVLVGIFIVGLSNVLFSDADSSSFDPGLQILGYIMIVVSFFINGFQYVYEQKLLAKYHLQPLEVVGYEGVFGFGIQVVIMAIFAFVPCPFSETACVFNSYGEPFIERAEVYFIQAGQNGLLVGIILLGVAAIATFNVSGVTITKHINALARTIADVSRTVLVWIVGIIVTVSIGATKPNYQWEIINLSAIFLQLFGFVILIVGNFVYNGFIKLPFIKPVDEETPLLSNHPPISKDGSNRQALQDESLNAISLISEN